MSHASLAKTQQFANAIWRTWGPALQEDWKNAPADYRPVVVPDWNGPGEHAICWETGAPDQWAFLLDGGIDEEFGFDWKPVPCPKGHWHEAYYSYVVLLYKDS